MSEEGKSNVKSLNEIELRVIAELMKNSRRSDRELARALHTSQPTVSRIIKRLEKMGIIKEYTMIPDFAKLGYKLMGISFIKLEDAFNQTITSEIRKETTEIEKNNPYAAFMGVDGEGLKKDRMFISLYKTYSDFNRAMGLAKRLPFVNIESLESFLVDLENKNNYRVLSMAAIANNILLLSNDAASEGVEP